jgi:hypothetical protein
LFLKGKCSGSMFCFIFFNCQGCRETLENPLEKLTGLGGLQQDLIGVGSYLRLWYPSYPHLFPGSNCDQGLHMQWLPDSPDHWLKEEHSSKRGLYNSTTIFSLGIEYNLY